MNDFDCFLDEDSGQQKFADKNGKLIQPKNNVVPYDETKAEELLLLVNMGHSLRKILKDLKLNARVLNSWKLMNPEFAQELQIATKSRVDHLLEETYDKDVKPLYDPQTDSKSLDFLAKRNRTVLNHVKHIAPERFVTSNISLTQNNATLNLNIPEGHEQQLDQFVGKLSHDGNFVPAG